MKILPNLGQLMNRSKQNLYFTSSFKTNIPLCSLTLHTQCISHCTIINGKKQISKSRVFCLCPQCFALTNQHTCSSWGRKVNLCCFFLINLFMKKAFHKLLKIKIKWVVSFLSAHPTSICSPYPSLSGLGTLLMQSKGSPRMRHGNHFCFVAFPQKGATKRAFDLGHGWL